MSVSTTIIIGSGVAAFTASIYLGRANMNPILIEGDHPGGLLTTTKMVENYPGFPAPGVDGYELTERLKQQSLDCGTMILSTTVDRIERLEDDFFVINKDKTCYRAKVIIICTGSIPRRLFIPGYDEFWRKGVSTCAVCDGSLPRYKNSPVAVVGGGNTACEFALHLSKTSKTVYLIHRGKELSKATAVMIDSVKRRENIIILYETVVFSISGSRTVESIQIKNEKESTIRVTGLFVAIGHTPNTSFLSDLVELDSEGYIIVNERRETNVPGIYAAGDVHDKVYKQIATAVGSGCIAALEAERYLHSLAN